jgi:hypothetical protein
MTIEIHQPELEALISQQLASGRFQDVEALLLHELRSTPIPKPAPKRSLAEVCAHGARPHGRRRFQPQSLDRPSIETRVSGFLLDTNVPSNTLLRRKRMSAKAFTKIMSGLEEAKAYVEGEREGYKATVPPSVGVKSID